jgi:uncharacterized protein YndB with AHSA1/START domain
MCPARNGLRLAAEVEGDALATFDAFTAALDRWWASAAGGAEVDLESHAGGRLVAERAPAEVDVELGRMKLWRPGSRLEAEWREPTWPEGLLTWITASFETTGPTTRIVVEHTGFEQLAAAGDEVARRYETLWRELLDSLRPAAEG